METTIYLLMNDEMRPQGICADLAGNLPDDLNRAGLTYAADLGTGAWYRTDDGGDTWTEMEHWTDLDSPEAVRDCDVIKGTQAFSELQEWLEEWPITDNTACYMLETKLGPVNMALRRNHAFEPTYADKLRDMAGTNTPGGNRARALVRMAHLAVSPWLAAGVGIQ